MDVDLIERMLAVFATLPARFLVNVGGFRDTYRAVPDNVYLDAWFPQPSVVARSDLFIHHGGNNSFCEALRFGVPSLVMPYCWDGHDNARRAGETGVGRHLDRTGWTPEQLGTTVRDLLADRAMRDRLAANAKRMAAAPGTERAGRRHLEAALASPSAYTVRPSRPNTCVRDASNTRPTVSSTRMASSPLPSTTSCPAGVAT